MRLEVEGSEPVLPAAAEARLTYRSSTGSVRRGSCKKNSLEYGAETREFARLLRKSKKSFAKSGRVSSVAPSFEIRVVLDESDDAAERVHVAEINPRSHRRTTMSGTRKPSRHCDAVRAAGPWYYDPARVVPRTNRCRALPMRSSYRSAFTTCAAPMTALFAAPLPAWSEFSKSGMTHETREGHAPCTGKDLVSGDLIGSTIQAKGRTASVSRRTRPEHCRRCSIRESQANSSRAIDTFCCVEEIAQRFIRHNMEIRRGAVSIAVRDQRRDVRARASHPMERRSEGRRRSGLRSICVSPRHGSLMCDKTAAALRLEEMIR